MGNHVVGQMFNAGVSAFSDKEIDEMTQEQALEIIDNIGQSVIASTSLDAEFDDYDNPNQKLGRVLIKAFHPTRYLDWKNKEYVDEKMDEEYYNNIYQPFRSRFGFW